MILVITNSFKAMRGKKVPRSAYDHFRVLLAHAEARLDFSLWRAAYRHLGWGHRVVELTLVEAPDDWNETTRRFQSSQCALDDLEACARAYVHALCEHYSINRRDVSNGSCPAFTLRSSSFGGHVAKGGNQHRSSSSLSAQHWGGSRRLQRETETEPLAP